MTFDIAAFDTRTKSEVGTDMTILRPGSPFAPFLDAEGKPLTITLKGRNSVAFKAAQREIQQRNADREARGIPRTDDDEKTDRFNLLCAVTVGWSFDTLDGQPFPFSPDNVKKLWADERWAWLQVQAINFHSSEGNFLAA